MSKPPTALSLLFAVLCFCSRAFGVATITNGTAYSYNTAEPTILDNYTTQVIVSHTSYTYSGGGGRGGQTITGTSVTTSTASSTISADFSSGWGSSGVTGWDYVGKLSDTYGSASAIYLGNGWVITCSHAISLTDYSASFTLSGSTYSVVQGTLQRVGNADLVMFYIGTSLSLPSLTLSTSSVTVGNSVVLVGYGAGVKAYGVANITTNPNSGLLYTTVSISGTSTDFLAKSGSTSLVGGDSGGAAFYYNGVTGAWVLSGINEAVATSGSGSSAIYYNYLIDVNTYASEIQTIMAEAVPEPASWALAVAGGFLVWRRQRRQRS